MSYLLDTNVCIAAINGKPDIVRRRFEQALDRQDKLFVTTVSHFELRYGASKSSRPEINNARIDLLLSTIETLPFADADAIVAGTIRADLERRGTPIGPYDCLIAAQSLRANLILVTANTREFQRVRGLRLENWTSR